MSSDLRTVSDLFKLQFKRLNILEARAMKRREGLLLLTGNIETIAHRVIALEKRLKALETK